MGDLKSVWVGGMHWNPQSLHWKPALPDDLISETRMRAAFQSSSPASYVGYAPRNRQRFVQDGQVRVVVLNPRHHRVDKDRTAAAELERAIAFERKLARRPRPG